MPVSGGVDVTSGLTSSLLQSSPLQHARVGRWHGEAVTSVSHEDEKACGATFPTGSVQVGHQNRSLKDGSCHPGSAAPDTSCYSNKLGSEHGMRHPWCAGDLGRSHAITLSNSRISVCRPARQRRRLKT